MFSKGVSREADCAFLLIVCHDTWKQEKCLMILKLDKNFSLFPWKPTCCARKIPFGQICTMAENLSLFWKIAIAGQKNTQYGVFSAPYYLVYDVIFHETWLTIFNSHELCTWPPPLSLLPLLKQFINIDKSLITMLWTCHALSNYPPPPSKKNCIIIYTF